MYSFYSSVLDSKIYSNVTVVDIILYLTHNNSVGQVCVYSAVMLIN